MEINARESAAQERGVLILAGLVLCSKLVINEFNQLLKRLV